MHGASRFSAVWCLLIASLISATAESVNPGEVPETVVTKSGPVIGTTTQSASGSEVNVYYGIPYAQPPVGPLRFRPSLMVTPWKTALDATSPKNICYQQIVNEWKSQPFLKEFLSVLKRPSWSEDCLTMTVWSPRPKAQNAPVIAFIHGGAFILGSSLAFVDGSALAAEGVVVVSLNYRLAVFGFFGLGLEDAPGNLGLWDQNLALRWIRDNVEAFGGDPNLVTIMGASAGSASVGFHMLSPSSKGLFARAVMSSGSPTSVWAIKEHEDSVGRAKQLLNELGCPDGNLTLGLECIRQKDPQDIMDASYVPDLLSRNNFIPTVDGRFLVEHPSVSLAAGRVNPVPVMVGSAEDEGGMIMMFILKHKDGRVFRKDLRKTVFCVDPTLNDRQIDALDVLYTGDRNGEDPYVLRDAVNGIFSDHLFLCGINEFAEGTSRAGLPVYRYVFAYKMSFQDMVWPEWLGALHAGDNMLVLGSPEFYAHLPKDHPDLSVSRRFLSHIVNFVKGGDPALDKTLFPGVPDWPRYRKGAQHYVLAANSTLSSGIRDLQCRFLDAVIPYLAAGTKYSGHGCQATSSEDRISQKVQFPPQNLEAGENQRKDGTKCKRENEPSQKRCSKRTPEQPQDEQKNKWKRTASTEQAADESKISRDREQAGEKVKKSQKEQPASDKKKKSKQKR